MFRYKVYQHIEENGYDVYKFREACMLKLKPLPGRVVLYFEPPSETSAAGIVISDGSKQRVEIGTVLFVGVPITKEDEAILSHIKIGDRIPVTYGAGTCYYKKDYVGGDEWLQDLRVYRISELAAKIVEESI